MTQGSGSGCLSVGSGSTTQFIIDCCLQVQKEPFLCLSLGAVLETVAKECDLGSKLGRKW